MSTVWNFIGLGVSLAIAALAWSRSRGSGGFYDAGVYAMTARTHAAYAVASLAFALFFAGAIALRWETLAVPGLAIGIAGATILVA